MTADDRYNRHVLKPFQRAYKGIRIACVPGMIRNTVPRNIWTRVLKHVRGLQHTGYPHSVVFVAPW